MLYLLLLLAIYYAYAHCLGRSLLRYSTLYIELYGIEV